MRRSSVLPTGKTLARTEFTSDRAFQIRAPVGRKPNGTSAAMRSEFHKGYQSIEHLPFAASGGRFAKGTILSVRMAPFVSPKKRKGLLHRRGITIPAPLWARQSCRFLETDSLHPPLAALRRFPLTPRAPWISHFSVKCDTAFSKRFGLLLSPLSLLPVLSGQISLRYVEVSANFS